MKTSLGYELKIKQISPMLVDKVQRSVPVPQVPTYSAETAGGGIEIHDHDETTISSPEEAAEWAKYQQAQADYGTTVTNKLLDLFIVMGIDVDLPEDDSWVEEHLYLGLDVPVDDPRGLKVYWVKNVAIGSADDLSTLMIEVMRGTGIDQEVLDDVQESFRRPPPEETTDGTDVEVAGIQSGRLDQQPQVSRS